MKKQIAHDALRNVLPSDITQGQYISLQRSWKLTCALEGGGAKHALPSGFSQIAEKRRRAALPFFQYLLTIELV